MKVSVQPPHPVSTHSLPRGLHPPRQNPDYVPVPNAMFSSCSQWHSNVIVWRCFGRAFGDSEALDRKLAQTTGASSPLLSAMGCSTAADLCWSWPSQSAFLWFRPHQLCQQRSARACEKHTHTHTHTFVTHKQLHTHPGTRIHNYAHTFAPESENGDTGLLNGVYMLRANVWGSSYFRPSSRTIDTRFLSRGQQKTVD